MGPAPAETPSDQRQFCHSIEHVVSDDRRQSFQYRRRRIGEVVGGTATDGGEGGQSADDGRRLVGQHLVLQVVGDQLGGAFGLQKGERGPHAWHVGRGACCIFSHSEKSQFRGVEGELAPAEEASPAGDDETAQAHVPEASRRHHNVHSGRCVGDEEAEEFGAGISRQFKAVENQCGGLPAIAGAQRRRQVCSRPSDIVGTAKAGLGARGLGEQTRQTGSELARACVSGGAVVTDVDALGAEFGCSLVEEHGAPKAGGRDQAAQGELVPQPECGQEAAAADQRAHHPSVFRSPLVRLRSCGRPVKEPSANTSPTTGGLRLVNAPS